MSFPRTNIWFWIWHSHMGQDAASKRHSLTDCNRASYPLPQGILYLVLTEHSMLEATPSPQLALRCFTKKPLKWQFSTFNKYIPLFIYLFKLWQATWALKFLKERIAWRKVKGSMGEGEGGGEFYVAHPAFLHFTTHNPFFPRNLNTSLTSELTPLTTSPTKNQYFPFY